MEPSDTRRRQLARMLDLPLENVQAISAGQAVRLGDAIFDEATDSDDVTGEPAALQYLEHRIAFLGPLIPANLTDAVRKRFIERWRSWERV